MHISKSEWRSKWTRHTTKVKIWYPKKRKRNFRVFPGGALVKNPPANAGTQVRALAQEDPTCHGATKPVRHNYWAWALEPTSHNYWALEPQLLSSRATTTEAHAPRACALQQEKPPQWEAHAKQRRVAPTHCNYRKPAHTNEDPTRPKINKLK